MVKKSDLAPQNQLLDSTIREAFAGLRSAVDKVWESIDGYVSLLDKPDNHPGDEISGTLQLEDMRRAYSRSLEIKDSLKPLIKKMNIRTTQFNRDVQRLQRQIMKDGLQLLPEELLAEIFSFAADEVEDSIVLSHVCKRFRSVVLSSQQLWNGYCIDFSWHPGKILAVAERSGFRRLKATIDWLWHDQKGERIASMQIIRLLSGHIAELYVVPSNCSLLNILWQALIGTKWTSLRTLKIKLTGSELWTPFYHFYEVCDMPSLRTLEVNFVPLPSLARNLSQCTLSFSCGYRVRAKDLLAFLSSAVSLEHLAISLKGIVEIEQDAFQVLRPVTIPSLVSLEVRGWFHGSGPLESSLINNLRPVSIKRLTLRSHPGSISGQFVSQFLLYCSSVQELVVECLGGNYTGMIDLGSVFRGLPGNIKYLAVSSQNKVSLLSRVNFVEPVIAGVRFGGHGLRRIRFFSCKRICKRFLGELHWVLQCMCHTAVDVEFVKCDSVQDGVFTLDAIESALLND